MNTLAAIGWEVVPRVGFGGLSISPHGIGIAIGVFVGAWLMARRARARGYDENHTWNGAAVGVVGAIIGARVAYVAGHLDRFSGPQEWLLIWQGGISLVGGLLGAFTAVWIYVKRAKIDFFELVDLGAPGLGIGIAVGRLGDLVIGDHLGKPTSFFLGWHYKGGQLISPPECVNELGTRVYPSLDGCIEPGMVVHQTALYDQFWSLVIFAILLVLARKPRRTGFLFISWALLYAGGRVATDFLRVDKRWFGLGLTGSQITSLIVIGVCVFLLIRYRGAPDWLLRHQVPEQAVVEDAAPASSVAQASSEPIEQMEMFHPDATPAPEPPAAPEPEPPVIEAETESPKPQEGAESPNPDELLSMGHHPNDDAQEDDTVSESD